MTNQLRRALNDIREEREAAKVARHQGYALANAEAEQLVADFEELKSDIPGGEFLRLVRICSAGRWPEVVFSRENRALCRWTLYSDFQARVTNAPVLGLVDIRRDLASMLDRGTY